MVVDLALRDLRSPHSSAVKAGRHILWRIHPQFDKEQIVSIVSITLCAYAYLSPFPV